MNPILVLKKWQKVDFKQQLRGNNMDRFMRITEVMHLTGLAKSTVWLWVKEGKLPASYKLGPRITVWKESEVMAYLNEVAA